MEQTNLSVQDRTNATNSCALCVQLPAQWEPSG